MVLTIVAFCFLMIFYAYAGYPLTLMLLLKLGVGNRRVSSLSSDVDQTQKQSVSVIVTIRNEEEVIRDKILNTMLLRFAGGTLADAISDSSTSTELIIASDASDDSSDEIVKEYEARGVKLVRSTIGGGKEAAQKLAVTQSSGEIIVFTDAKIKLSRDALTHALAYFNDLKIGAISSVDLIEGDKESGSGEGLYVRYEMWLRSLESSFHSLVGLSGSCFAVRREVCEDFPTDIPSDFALLLKCVRLGFRGVHASNVVGTYRAVASPGAEFQRKRRTVLRGMAAFFSRIAVLNPVNYGIFSWQVFSHKLIRWLVPWFGIIAALGSLILSTSSTFFLLFSELLAVFVLLGFFGYTSKTLSRFLVFRLPQFFIISNAAIFLAWIDLLSGKRTVRWKPSDKV